MATLQDLNRRIKSVTNTRKITKAMEMVAAAKLRRAQQRIETLRPFADAMVELTARVAKGIQSGGAPSPLLEERDVKSVGIVMFTGDRGLAGALNANILRRSLLLAKEHEAAGREVHWVGIGKKGVSSLLFRKIKVDQAYRGITDSPRFRDAEAIANYIIKRFKDEEYDRVTMVYNSFESAVTQVVVVQDLLPLSDELLLEALSNMGKLDEDCHPERTDKPVLAPDPREHRGLEEAGKKHGLEPDWFFEPDNQTLLDRLLPTYVEQSVFRGLLESTASEHGARMSAMRNASENAGDIIDQVTLQRNRARQAEITQEILEVVGGAEALK